VSDQGCPRIEHPEAIISLKYRPGLVNLALLELFGLFEIQVMPPEADFQPGAHQFKVSLGARCWRRIRCGGETDLAALASTILAAFDFDEDHLYRFSYQNRYGQRSEIDHADLVGETDNAVVDAVRIGELSLTEGQRIAFLFDFGDAWTFEIVAERPEAGPLPPSPLIPGVVIARDALVGRLAPPEH
jgi:hypothetical protein